MARSAEVRSQAAVKNAKKRSGGAGSSGTPLRDWDPELEGKEWEQGEVRENEGVWTGGFGDGERQGWQRE